MTTARFFTNANTKTIADRKAAVRNLTPEELKKLEEATANVTNAVKRTNPKPETLGK